MTRLAKILIVLTTLYFINAHGHNEHKRGAVRKRQFEIPFPIPLKVISERWHIHEPKHKAEKREALDPGKVPLPLEHEEEDEPKRIGIVPLSLNEGPMLLPKNEKLEAHHNFKVLEKDKELIKINGFLPPRPEEEEHVPIKAEEPPLPLFIPIGQGLHTKIDPYPLPKEENLRIITSAPVIEEVIVKDGPHPQHGILHEKEEEQMVPHIHGPPNIEKHPLPVSIPKMEEVIIRKEEPILIPHGVLHGGEEHVQPILHGQPKIVHPLPIYEDEEEEIPIEHHKLLHEKKESSEEDFFPIEKDEHPPQIIHKPVQPIFLPMKEEKIPHPSEVLLPPKNVEHLRGGLFPDDPYLKYEEDDFPPPLPPGRQLPGLLEEKDEEKEKNEKEGNPIVRGSRLMISFADYILSLFTRALHTASVAFS